MVHAIGTVDAVEKQCNTDQRTRTRLILAHGPSAVVLAMALALSGCAITVPASEAPSPTQHVPPPTFAPPTVVAGYDAKAVAAAPMTFDAGKTLLPNVPIGFNDLLGEPQQTADHAQTPGPPEWKLLLNNVAGQTQYSNDAGCQLAYWTTSNQGPLITQGDDKASSVALMKYLIPSVTDSALTEAQLPWVAEAGKSGTDISFLTFGTRAGKGVMASTVWGRLLGTANTGLLVTLACPTDDVLAASPPKMMAKLSVAPPSN